MTNIDVHFSSKTDLWSTPQWFFDEMNTKYGPFDLDVAASHDNAKTPVYMTQDGTFQTYSSGPFQRYGTDGLTSNWSWCSRVWMNPPYGKTKYKCKPFCHKKTCAERGSHTFQTVFGIDHWVRKAYEESLKGCVVVALLPARTDPVWFHRYIYKQPNVEVTFLAGRLKFGSAVNSAPFPSMIVVFRPPSEVAK